MRFGEQRARGGPHHLVIEASIAFAVLAAACSRGGSSATVPSAVPATSRSAATTSASGTTTPATSVRGLVIDAAARAALPCFGAGPIVTALVDSSLVIFGGIPTSADVKSCQWLPPPPSVDGAPSVVVGRESITVAQLPDARLIANTGDFATASGEVFDRPTWGLGAFATFDRGVATNSTIRLDAWFPAGERVMYVFLHYSQRGNHTLSTMLETMDEIVRNLQA